ncbi:MAG: histidine phosphatase family protein, partial [Terrimicrobiaceae bacterium]
AADDFSRRLTPKGMAQAEKVGMFFLRGGLEPDLVIASPVVRARETAEALCAKVGRVGLKTGGWLGCGMSAESCFQELEAFRELPMVVLVGHEPDFGEAISWILGIESSGGVHVRKASLTAVSISSFARGGGRLEFSVPARLM